MKKIDDDLGGTTPLNVILKFPTIRNDNDNSKIMMTSFQNGMKTLKKMKINQNIGSLEIKWIKY